MCAQKTYAIEGRKLNKRFRLGEQTVVALDSVDIAVEPGEFVSVMGASGSGKSTLLHLLGLLEVPDSGEVIVGGVSASGLDDDELTRMRREQLGFVFQTFELIPNLTALENILLPAEVAGNREGARERLDRLAARLGLSNRLQHRPKQLSGGQRQRVAIARALINDPVVILADEPTGNLDSETGQEVLDLLRNGVDEQGWTVVMVTHDLKAALTANRILFLRDGRWAGSVTASEPGAREEIERFVGV